MRCQNSLLLADFPAAQSIIMKENACKIIVIDKVSIISKF